MTGGRARDAVAIAGVLAAGGMATRLRRAAAEARDHRRLGDMAWDLARLPDARRALGDAARELLHADVVIQFAALDDELVSALVSGVVHVPAVAIRVDDPQSAVARSFREQELVFVNAGPELDTPTLRHIGARAILAAPSSRGDERLGAWEWIWRTRKRRLSDRERRMAELLGAVKGLLVGRWELLAEAENLSRSQTRSALARELDHSIDNALAAQRLFLDTAARALPTDAEAVRELIPVMSTDLTRAQQEIREVLRALHGSRPLTSLGLADVLGPALSDFHVHHPAIDLNVRTSIGQAQHATPAIRETVYFVLREALDDAALTHAHAVRVDLHADLGEVTLTLEHDGRGADAEPRQLVTLQRTQLARGELDVDTLPDGRTRLTLRLPHPATEPAAEPR
jgi:signal transduction histidine kinase